MLQSYGYSILVVILAIHIVESIKIMQFKAIYGQDMKSPEAVNHTLLGLTRHQCARNCDGFCEGFNFYGTLGTCELLKVASHPTTVTSHVGVTYYERLDHRRCADQTLCSVFGFDLDWDEADDMCRRIHPASHLVEVQSLAENTVLGNIVEQFPDQVSFWTGGRRPVGGGRYEFYWTHNNAPFTFTNWHAASTQPYRTADLHDCVSAYIGWDWMWNDYKCYQRNMYFCEF